MTGHLPPWLTICNKKKVYVGIAAINCNAIDNFEKHTRFYR